jgi:hypothetical protein
MVDDETFTHVFSGISVWLEPDPAHASLLLNEMDTLAVKFGDAHRLFMPHCTLLYNTSFPSSSIGNHDYITDHPSNYRQKNTT